MSEHIFNHLRRWKFLADVLVAEHHSHAHRWQRVAVIKRLIMLECHKGTWAQDAPLWVDTLLELLSATNFETGIPSYIDHNDAKSTLRLFSETCLYIIEHYHEVWFDGQRRYNYTTGEPVDSWKGNSPFIDIGQENDSDGDDDQDDDSPDPFGDAIANLPI